MKFNLILFRENGKLLEFIKDFHSGKLHKEFHNPQKQIIKNVIFYLFLFSLKSNKFLFYLFKKNPISSLPESVFIHLTPSKQRYSFRDEL